MADNPAKREMRTGPRRECLACGAQTNEAACEICGSVALGPPLQRFDAPQPSNLAAGRFLYGPARTSRPD